ncbi:MAG: Colicin V production protein [Tenericutes bacterium ADurb.BinA155]|jgi:hypothetical protein|nr:MAG: Colicin V production protein [Tenericutes bacterium ADurb.BinA155]
MLNIPIYASLFFDWFSLAYILLILICTGIGLWKGVGKMLPRLAIMIVAAIAAFYLCKIVGGWFEQGTTWDESLASWIHDRIKDKDPAAVNEDPVVALTEDLFRNYIKLPDALWNPFWAALSKNIPSTGTDNPARIIGVTLSHFVFIAGGFALVFLVVFLLGFTTLWIIEGVRKKAGKAKPSWLSRGLGAGVGLLVAIVLIYCCSLGIDILASAQLPGASNHADVAEYLHLSDPNYWSLAKWLCNQTGLYDQLMKFLKITASSSTASTASAVSSALSSGSGTLSTSSSLS